MIDFNKMDKRDIKFLADAYLFTKQDLWIMMEIIEGIKLVGELPSRSCDDVNNLIKDNLERMGLKVVITILNIVISKEQTYIDELLKAENYKDKLLSYPTCCVDYFNKRSVIKDELEREIIIEKDFKKSMEFDEVIPWVICSKDCKESIKRRDNFHLNYNLLFNRYKETRIAELIKYKNIREEVK